MRTLTEIAESTQNALRTIEADAVEALRNDAIEGEVRGRLIALQRRVHSIHRDAERLAAEIPEIGPRFGGK